jgi:hypothetical protein
MRISDVPGSWVVDDRDELDAGRLGVAACVDDHRLEFPHLLRSPRAGRACGHEVPRRIVALR